MALGMILIGGGRKRPPPAGICFKVFSFGFLQPHSASMLVS
jgi:hypothetical protein